MVDLAQAGVSVTMPRPAKNFGCSKLTFKLFPERPRESFAGRDDVLKWRVNSTL